MPSRRMLAVFEGMANLLPPSIPQATIAGHIHVVAPSLSDECGHGRPRPAKPGRPCPRRASEGRTPTTIGRGESHIVYRLRSLHSSCSGSSTTGVAMVERAIPRPWRRPDFMSKLLGRRSVMRRENLLASLACALAIALSVAAAAESSRFYTFERHTDRPGLDYSNAPSNSVQDCSFTCQADGN